MPEHEDVDECRKRRRERDGEDDGESAEQQAHHRDARERDEGREPHRPADAGVDDIVLELADDDEPKQREHGDMEGLRDADGEDEERADQRADAALLGSISRRMSGGKLPDDEMFAGAARAIAMGGRPMKLSVLGAAGATGIPLVEQALAAGHRVTALVRSGQKLTISNPNLHVVEGDATDRAAVSEAMNGGDAVISVLGARGPVMTEATRAIVDAAKQKGPERVVMLSSFAVARDRLTPVTKVVTGLAMGSQIKDKTAGEEVLRASSLGVRCDPDLPNGRVIR